jgi:LuxR family maltose regulon positive regulatory protein
VIPSKLRPPRLDGALVERPRLLERLRVGRSRALTLVSGPTGAGKSTLLAQWAAADAPSTRFAWVSLDGGDRDPVRLWAHAVWALSEVAPGAGSHSLPSLVEDPARANREFLWALTEELHGSDAVVLVLDNWQLLRGSAAAASVLTFVQHAPEQVQTVIASRSKSPAALEGPRFAREVQLVDGADLRMTAAEIAALAEALEVAAPAAGVADLELATEGWAAGIELLLRLGGAAGAPGSLSSVLELLRRSVLDELPAEERLFLRRTSILEQLSGPLCDGVTLTTRSTARLAELDEAGLFVIPLDGGHQYRYHRLFADALALELELVEPEAVAELNLRASRWFEAIGDADAAIRHAIAARDVRRSSDLVATHASAFVRNGRGAAVGSWLEALSWPAAEADAQLAIIRVLDGVRRGDASTRDIEAWLEVAAEQADGTDDLPPAVGAASIESAAAVLRSLYLCRGPAIALGDARRALDLERSPPGWRADALAALGQALFLLGRRDEARAALEEARRVPGTHGEHAAAPIALGVLALVELDDGDVAAADVLARDALSSGGLETSDGVGRIAAGRVALARGRISAGTAALEQAAAEVVPMGPNLWRAYALLHLARAAGARGARGDAQRALGSARQILARAADTGIVGDLLADGERRVDAASAEATEGASLTGTELRVLRLFELGLSRAQVASELFVTLNTVKTHTRAIYRKLGASSRDEAVARGRELGLL